jgi:hypothetical protein
VAEVVKQKQHATICIGQWHVGHRALFLPTKPIPLVRRYINTFTLGARSVDPTIECRVIFTGDWSVFAKEAAARRHDISLPLKGRASL